MDYRAVGQPGNHGGAWIVDFRLWIVDILNLLYLVGQSCMRRYVQRCVYKNG